MDRARMAPLLLLLLLFPFAAAAPTAAPTGKSPPAVAKAPAPAPPVTPPKTLPACPLTGKPATKPTIPHSRCVEAQQLSCCADCADLTFPIQVLAIDVAAALEPVTQGLATAPADVCQLFKGHEECEQLIEQLVCAVTCNPDSGYYFIDTPTGPYMQVCKAFAQQVYDKCSTLKVGDLSVDMLIYNPEELIKQAIVPLVAEAVPGFTAGVSAPSAPSSAPAPAPGSDASPGSEMAPSSGGTVDGGSSPPTAPPPAAPSPPPPPSIPSSPPPAAPSPPPPPSIPSSSSSPSSPSTPSSSTPSPPPPPPKGTGSVASSVLVTLGAAVLAALL
ncbi:unnamed protein product [Closterium sp. NIES-54]